MTLMTALMKYNYITLEKCNKLLSLYIIILYESQYIRIQIENYPDTISLLSLSSNAVV